MCPLFHFSQDNTILIIVLKKPLLRTVLILSCSEVFDNDFHFQYLIDFDFHSQFLLLILILIIIFFFDFDNHSQF